MLHRDEDPVSTRNPDGSIKLDLKGGGGNVMVMRINSDGTPEVSCINTEAQARAFFAPQERAKKNAAVSADKEHKSADAKERRQ